MGWLEVLILACAGLVAGVINTMAGGGSLLTLPVLIFAGLSPHVANATNRVGVILQSLVASGKFKQEGQLELRQAWRVMPWTLVGSLAGATLSLDLNEALFKQVIGVVMLLMLGVLMVRPGRWLEDQEPDPNKPLSWGARLMFLATGLYGGFIQAGVGVLLLAALVLGTGSALTRANALKAVLVAAFTIPPLVVFMAHDLVEWAPGLALASGSMMGGWLGAKLSVSWGPRVIRYVLMVVVVTSSTRLLGLW